MVTKSNSGRSRKHLVDSAPRLKVADIVTLLSVVFAVCGFVVAGQGNGALAGIFLLCSVVCDGLDGKIATWMGEASEFGMYLDSLGDIVAFGAMPVAIVLVLLPNSIVLLCTCVVYLAAGMFRLARFQVTRLVGEFQGMPITLNGFFLGVMLLFVHTYYLLFLVPGYFVVASVLMVSTWRVKKL